MSYEIRALLGKVRLYLTNRGEVLVADLEGNLLSDRQFRLDQDPKYRLFKSLSQSDPNIGESEKIRPGHIALKYPLNGDKPVDSYLIHEVREVSRKEYDKCLDRLVPIMARYQESVDKLVAERKKTAFPEGINEKIEEIVLAYLTDNCIKEIGEKPTLNELLRKTFFSRSSAE